MNPYFCLEVVLLLNVTRILLSSCSMPIGRGRGRGGGLGSGGMSNIGQGGRGGRGGGGFGRFDGGGGGRGGGFGGGGGWKPEPASMAAILMDEKFNFWDLPDKHRHGRTFVAFAHRTSQII